jgi:hypothetical protein
VVYLGFLLFFLLVATFFGGAMLALSRWMDRDDAAGSSGPAEPAVVVHAVELRAARSVDRAAAEPAEDPPSVTAPPPSRRPRE